VQLRRPQAVREARLIARIVQCVAQTFDVTAGVAAVIHAFSVVQPAPARVAYVLVAGALFLRAAFFWRVRT
jgi:hypothetical protein